MINKFEELEWKNDIAFLNEIKAGEKEQTSTSDSSQKSGVMMMNQKTTKKLRKELAELVNDYRHQGF
jgi:hypothetical protein